MELKNKNILVVLDKSGSMEKRRDSTISSYNEYVGSLKDVVVNISLFTFNASVQKIGCDRELLSRETYVPSGNTALFDAIAKAIYSVPEGETGLVVIISDGEENASRYQNGVGLASLIADKKLVGWQFLFMGCEDSCIKDANTLRANYAPFSVSTFNYTPGWKPGKFIKGHEVYCATQNYMNGA